MLGKLLRYDLMAGAKKYFVMSAILAMLVLGAGFVSLLHIDALTVLMVTLSILGSVGYLVAYAVISVIHFHAQMIKRESYLMYTIPVTTNKLLLSKLLAVFIWGIFTVATLTLLWVCSLDFLLLRSLGTSLAEVFSQIDGVMATLNFDLFSFTVITSAVSFLYTVPFVAFCISLMNVPALKNRNMGTPMAVIAYVFGGQALGIAQMLIWLLWSYLEGSIQRVMDNDITYFGSLYGGLQTIMLITSVLFAPLFYLLALRVFKKHRSV